jgi:serine/threonine-protein kinase
MSKSGAYAVPSSTAGSSAAIPNEPALPNKRGRASVVGAILFLVAVAAFGVVELRTPASLTKTVVPAAQALAPPGQPLEPATATAAAIAPTVADKPVEPAPSPTRSTVEPAPQKVTSPVRVRAPKASAPKSNEAERMTPPAPAAPIDPCRPPYTVDSAGQKHFKVDCVIDGRQ